MCMAKLALLFTDGVVDFVMIQVPKFLKLILTQWLQISKSNNKFVVSSLPKYKKSARGMLHD